MGSILVDSNEPDQVLIELAKVHTASKYPLNQSDKADYFWLDCAGHTMQIERKQNNELLSSGLDDVEEQLRREYVQADKTSILIEGIIAPWGMGCCTYKHRKYGKSDAYYSDKVYNQSYSGVVSWLWTLYSKYGINTIQTLDTQDTIKKISAIAANSFDPNHVTFNRHIPPKIQLAELNKHVLALMALSRVYGIGIGEQKAGQLIARYGSLYDVIVQEAEALGSAGIGLGLANKFLKGVGK